MPLHHRTIGSSRSRIIVVPCVLTPQLPPWAIPHLNPYSLTILTLLASLHSPYSHSLTLSLHFPSLCRLHTGTSPILSTFLSMACVLKRFPLTSPRKLSLPCVKPGFLRTAEPHRTSQLSPCSPLMSQCHVHAVPGSDVPCPIPSPRMPHTFAPHAPAPSPRCHAPAPGFPFLEFLTIISISPSVSSKSTFPSENFCYL